MTTKVKKTDTQKPANYPSADEITDWKEQHGKLFEFDVDGSPAVILRKPRMYDLERASASSKKSGKPMTFNSSILNNCKLWQATEELTDDQIQAIYSKLEDIIMTVEVEVKEL